LAASRLHAAGREHRGIDPATAPGYDHLIFADQHRALSALAGADRALRDAGTRLLSGDAYSHGPCVDALRRPGLQALRLHPGSALMRPYRAYISAGKISIRRSHRRNSHARDAPPVAHLAERPCKTRTATLTTRDGCNGRPQVANRATCRSDS
jgi:hypothetical protein